MLLARRIWPLVIVSCLALSPCAKAALEKAAGKASTSVGMANTAGNAWALETDPSISNPPNDGGGPSISSYYLSDTSGLIIYYDTTQFTLDTNSNSMPDLVDSTSGENGFEVMSYTIDYYANPSQPDSYSGTDSNGEPFYPSITVTATSDTYHADAADNLPDMFRPVGLIENIVSTCPIGDLGGNQPNATEDLVMYDFNFTSTGPDEPVYNPAANGVAVAPNAVLTFTDPSLPTNSSDYTETAAGPANIDSAVVPEPASASLLAVVAAGLLGRRRQSR
jgi:hypothetical protein